MNHEIPIERFFLKVLFVTHGRQFQNAVKTGLRYVRIFWNNHPQMIKFVKKFSEKLFFLTIFLWASKMHFWQPWRHTSPKVLRLFAQCPILMRKLVCFGTKKHHQNVPLDRWNAILTTQQKNFGSAHCPFWSTSAKLTTLLTDVSKKWKVFCSKFDIDLISYFLKWFFLTCSSGHV